MRINFLYKGILVAATLCVAPAAFPASPNGNPPRVRSVASGNGTYASDASNLLQQVQADALRAEYYADELRTITREPFVTEWHEHCSELRRIRTHVNDMDKLLSQLRANESEALPWQQKAIEGIAPAAVNLTDTTQTAIVSLNGNMEQAEIYYSNMHGLARDMSNQATLIRHAIGSFEKSADARREPQQHKQT